MIFRIYIIDDDIEFANELLSSINEILHSIGINYLVEINPKKVEISTKECQVWHFLDIEMPQKNGFQFAEEIYKNDNNAKIIFISDFSSYVFDSYDYHATNYLLKSDYMSKLKRLLYRLIDESNISYSFTYYDTVTIIPVNRILFITKEENKVKIVTSKKFFEHNNTLKRIIDDLNGLCPNQFFYINKSQIVNFKQIKRIDQNKVILENDAVLYISRMNRKAFKKAYYEYMARYL